MCRVLLCIYNSLRRGAPWAPPCLFTFLKREYDTIRYDRRFALKKTDRQAAITQ